MITCLLDTCVLIDAFRGNDKAMDFLDTLEHTPCISSLTVAELYAGVREGKERQQLEHMITQLLIIPLDTEMATQGGLYRRQYSKSHNVGLIDALLAACAKLKNLTLITLNDKHFPMLDNIIRPY